MQVKHKWPGTDECGVCFFNRTSATIFVSLERCFDFVEPIPHV